MKIGILTLPLRTNFGGILQAYALQTALKRMGYETILIESKKDSLYPFPLWKVPFCYAKRLFYKYVLMKKDAIEIFYEHNKKKRNAVITQRMQLFKDKYIFPKIEIKKLRSLYNENNLDAIIVGSDQVWRVKYYSNNITEAYLSFAKRWKIKRIAYAASFGSSEWEYTEKQTELCRDLIQKFEALSVREDTGVLLCKQYFNVDAQHVLDPTMLLNIQDYIQLFNSDETPKSSGDLLVYFLDNTIEKEKIIDMIVSQKGYVPFRAYVKIEDKTFSLDKQVALSIEQWLRGFYDAEFVLTDSFHACVFSILFNKPFFVFGNKERGLSRFVSLLRLFDLEERLIFSSAEIESKFTLSFDWESINKKLETLKKMSYRYLTEALK
jgi:hypothetical protein